MNDPSDRIHVVESGPRTDTVVVLVHGSLDRAAGMARMARLLQGHVRVVRYDRRGYGHSRPHPGPHTVGDQVDDLESVLSGRRAVIFGHSFGGHVAIAGSIRLGGQILGVSVYETPLSWVEWWPGNSAGAITQQVSPEDAAEAFMRRLVGNKMWESLPERTREERRSEGAALQAELGALRSGAPWETDDIQTPLIAGHGTKAMPHHIRAMQVLSSEAANANLVVLDGAGHGAPNSHPAMCVDLLVRPHLERAGISTS